MLLAFGPDDYYFFDDQTGHLKWRAGVDFTTYMTSNALGKINSVAFGEDDAYFVSYTTPNGLQHMNRWNDPKSHHPALHSWLFTENVPHDRKSVFVSMGMNGAFFAASSQGHRWRNIPEALTDYYQKFTRVDLFTRSRVNTVDLGVNGAFMGIGVDNTWFWDLGDEYPELSKLIGQKGVNDITFAAVNPFAPNQHVVVFKNNTVHWSVPPLWLQDLQSLMQQIATGAGAHVPTTPRPPSRPVPNSTSSSSGRWQPPWRGKHANTSPGAQASPTTYSPPPAASPVVSTPGGGGFDWNQAMGLTQSALDAYNNAQGQGQGGGGGGAANGLQMVNDLANNGLMIGQVVGQLGGAAACCMM